MPAIEFWYEFASTYSYPAAMRIDEQAAKHGVDVRWQPFLLGPIFKRLGWSTSPFNLQPEKGRYMWRDMERICQAAQLPPLTRPEPFPQNGLLAARIAISLPDNGPRAEFSRRVYQAQFAQGRQIDDPEMLSDILSGMDKSPRQVIEHATQSENKQNLISQVEQAEAHGIFGAPSLITSGGELFWGNDRLGDAIAWELAH